MMTQARRGTPVVLLTFALALVLSTMPLPDGWLPFRPPFLLLTVVYWLIALPHRYGIGWAFVCGLILDVVAGQLLGLDALVFSIIGYFCVLLYSRVRMYSRLMQAVFVAMLVGASLLLHLWIENAIRPTSIRANYWLPILSSAVLWFVWFPLLRAMRRHFHVS